MELVKHEDHTIEIWAYNLETVLDEKLRNAPSEQKSELTKSLPARGSIFMSNYKYCRHIKQPILYSVPSGILLMIS